jgi:hypothetical protein
MQEQKKGIQKSRDDYRSSKKWLDFGVKTNAVARRAHVADIVHLLEVDRWWEDHPMKVTRFYQAGTLDTSQPPAAVRASF